jgi:hypothetical protein
MATPNLLERRGPADKRRTRGLNNRFCFDFDRAQCVPHVHFTRRTLRASKIDIEVDIFSMRQGWEHDDHEKWEEEKIFLQTNATPAGFREAYRIARCFARGYTVTVDNITWLGLFFHRQTNHHLVLSGGGE